MWIKQEIVGKAFNIMSDVVGITHAIQCVLSFIIIVLYSSGRKSSQLSEVISIAHIIALFTSFPCFSYAPKPLK